MTALILVAALLMAGTSLVRAVQDPGYVDDALLHLALALVLAAVGGHVLRRIVTDYQQVPAVEEPVKGAPARRRTDLPDA